MLRGICLVVGTGLFLAACSGDSKKPQGTSEPGPGGAPGADTIVCGDGEREGDEECDNGERNDDDAACTSACLDAVCGDGLIRTGREECDDGDDNADDGACTTECAEARCGDGLVWAGEEECDDGNDNADDGACTAQCLPARCGDGLVWAGYEECDDGNENVNDACPDGPDGTCEVAPEPATGLGWQQGTHTNSTSLTATWTASPALDLETQELQLFSDDACTEASGTPLPLPSTSSASLAITVAGEGTYTFRIITRDNEGRQSTSECSPPLVVDTTAPLPATGLGFAETSPHDSLTVHGTWTRSTSLDLATQSIQLYGGGVCAVTLGSPTPVSPASAEQYPIVTPSNATYSYKVISADLAGNTAVSACSPAIQTAGGQPYTAVFKGLPQTVNQVRIDPKSASTMYATVSSGQVYKSTNTGMTWTLQCVSANIQSNPTYYGSIKVSPDGTAYAAGHSQFSRVEALSGAECPVVISNSAAWASYYHSNRLAIDSTGKLYTWTYTDPEGLVSSLDQGDSYDLINTTPSLFNSMEVDPFDDDHLVAVFSQHSTSPEGIHHSINGGLNWTQTDATFTNYQDGIRFNPAVEGWIYLGGGHYSDDGGENWSTNANYDCLEIDAAGSGYRLVAGASATQLQRAADMTSPSWSTLYTFTGVQADLEVSMVSVVGASIAVVLEGRLFISTNAGSSFAPIVFPSTEGELTASSIVAHGSTVYTAANGRIYKSSDAAQNWTEVYAPAQALGSDTMLHLNPAVPDQVLARPEAWNSTYEERVDVTFDGGASWGSTADCCYGWAGIVALGATDGSRVYYFGWEPRYSINGGLTFMESSSDGDLVWYPWPAAFVSPASNNIGWYGDDDGRFIEFNQTAGTDTNIASRLPFATPAGMDLIQVGASWHLRIISRTGEIAVSDDFGATFTLVPGSGGLPAANQRIFVSHPGSPQLIATAPLLSDDVAYSPTLGASWVQSSLANCQTRSLALTDGQLLVACEGGSAMGMAAP